MKKGLLHILIVLALLLTAACTKDYVPENPAPGLVLTVRCEDPALTKSTPEDGETRFNENLIKSVDFFFYPGAAPAGAAPAVYHERVDLAEDPVTYNTALSSWEATFSLVLKRTDAEQIFTAANSP